MSSLLAILLVSQPDQSSPFLSFAWPPSFPSPPSPQHQLSKNPYPNPRHPILPTHPFSHSSPPLHAHLPPPKWSAPTSYLNFEPDEWAAMLTPARHGSPLRPSNSPDPPISHHKLELLIDALAIIAHPVLISQKPLLPNPEHPQERGRTRTRSGEKDLVGSQESFPAMHSSVQLQLQPSLPPTDPSSFAKLALIAPPLSSSSLPRSASRPPVSQLTRMMMSRSNFVPTDASSNTLWAHPRPPESVRSTSSPSPVPGHRPLPYQETTYSPIHPPASTAARHHSPPPPLVAPAQMVPLQSFTLALVIDAPPASQLSQQLDMYYCDVVLKLTAALKLLERQSSYLTREIHRITCTQAERRDTESSRSASQNKRTGTCEMMQLIEQSSDLARALARVYEGLKSHGAASITLDGQLPVDLLLHDEFLCSEPAPDHWLASNSTWLPCPESDLKDRFANIEAWKSLLLLEDPKTLVEQTAPQSLLAEFIKLIKPFLALAEYKAILDTDSSTICSLTQHLLYFRKALLVDLVSLDHTYQLVSCPPPHPLASLSDQFSVSFPRVPHLVVVLSKIGKRPRMAFQEVMEEVGGQDREIKLEVLIWLLKHGLVRRERTHVRLKVDRETKLRVAARMDRPDAQPDELGSQSPRSQTHAPSTQPVRVPAPSSPFAPAGPGPASSPLITTTNATPELHAQSATTSQSSLLRFSTTMANTLPKQQQRAGETGLGVLAFGGTRGVDVGSLGSVVCAMEMKRRMRRVARALVGDAEEPSKGNEEEEQALSLEEAIIGEPGKLSDIERLWIDEICAGKSEVQKRWFRLTVKYLNGKHSIEEILSRSGLITNPNNYSNSSSALGVNSGMNSLGNNLSISKKGFEENVLKGFEEFLMIFVVT